MRTWMWMVGLSLLPGLALADTDTDGVDSDTDLVDTDPADSDSDGGDSDSDDSDTGDTAEPGDTSDPVDTDGSVPPSADTDGVVHPGDPPLVGPAEGWRGGCPGGSDGSAAMGLLLVGGLARSRRRRIR